MVDTQEEYTQIISNVNVVLKLSKTNRMIILNFSAPFVCLSSPGPSGDH